VVNITLKNVTKRGEITTSFVIGLIALILVVGVTSYFKTPISGKVT